MRLLLALVVLLVFASLPATAAASARAAKDGSVSVRAADDGSLSVRAAKGTISLAVRGATVGKLDSGRVIVEDPDPTDGKGPVVIGAEKTRDVSDAKSVYSGQKLRFRLVGPLFRVKIVGTGIDLSAVGRGSVTLDGDGLRDGLFSLNDSVFQSLPDTPTTFLLIAGGAG